MAQVFDALSFYLDLQIEINEYIDRNQVPDDLVHPALKIHIDKYNLLPIDSINFLQKQ